MIVTLKLRKLCLIFSKTVPNCPILPLHDTTLNYAKCVFCLQLSPTAGMALGAAYFMPSSVEGIAFCGRLDQAPCYTMVDQHGGSYVVHDAGL